MFCVDWGKMFVYVGLGIMILVIVGLIVWECEDIWIMLFGD